MSRPRRHPRAVQVIEYDLRLCRAKLGWHWRVDVRAEIVTEHVEDTQPLLEAGIPAAGWAVRRKAAIRKGWAYRDQHAAANGPPQLPQGEEVIWLPELEQLEPG